MEEKAAGPTLLPLPDTTEPYAIVANSSGVYFVKCLRCGYSRQFDGIEQLWSPAHSFFPSHDRVCTNKSAACLTERDLSWITEKRRAKVHPELIILERMFDMETEFGGDKMECALNMFRHHHC